MQVVKIIVKKINKSGLLYWNSPYCLHGRSGIVTQRFLPVKTEFILAIIALHDQEGGLNVSVQSVGFLNWATFFKINIV